MEAVRRLRRQPLFDQAVEILLIALCFAASIYGLVLLSADAIIR